MDGLRHKPTTQITHDQRYTNEGVPFSVQIVWGFNIQFTIGESDLNVISILLELILEKCIAFRYNKLFQNQFKLDFNNIQITFTGILPSLDLKSLRISKHQNSIYIVARCWIQWYNKRGLE